MTDPLAGALLVVGPDEHPDIPEERLVDARVVAGVLSADGDTPSEDEVTRVVRARVTRLVEDGRTTVVVVTDAAARARWHALAADVPAPSIDWHPGVEWPHDWTPPGTPRRPRLDLLLDRFPTTGVRAQLAELADRIDETAFGRLFVMDHLRQIPVLGEPEDPLLETWTLLGALATSSTRVGLGPLVSQPVTRHPALIARAAATLDVLSEGRAVLGLGAGAYAWEAEAFGFALPPPGERVDRLAEAIGLCRTIWAPGGAPYSGRYYDARDTRTAPRPLAGTIPIIVGGQGPRVLRLAGRHGDGVNLFGGPRRVAAAAEVVRAAAEAAGRGPGDVEVTWLGRVTPPPADVHALRRPGASLARTVLENGVGSVDEVCERFDRLGAAGIDTAVLVLPPIWTPGYLEHTEQTLARNPQGTGVSRPDFDRSRETS